MKFLKVVLKLCFLMATLAAISPAQTSSPPLIPTIQTVTVLNNDAYPLIEIRGAGFGHDQSVVQIFINDTPQIATIAQVKNKKIVAQLAGNQLCSGVVSVRVFVNKLASNLGNFLYDKGVPTITSISPEHAEANSVVEIKGENLSCQPANNLVTFNDTPVAVLGMANSTLSVRVPDNIVTGPANIRVIVSGHSSDSKAFVIDTKPVNNNNNATPTDTMLKFKNATGLVGGAGFTPMFNIRDMVKTNNGEFPLWDMNFYGTHQAIVKAPWVTTNGTQQLALVTLDCRYNSNLPINISKTKEKYVYVLISYPRDPEKPYDEVENPFWWGTFALCSESAPKGFISNSRATSTGGIESFEISKDPTVRSKITMSAKVIAPDLGVYYEYGINYSKAGAGKVSMPKVATITMTFNDAEPGIPMGDYHLGDVTITDESGTNGSITTNSTLFKSKLVAEDITFFW